MSVLIAGFTARLLLGNYLYLGFPMVITTITFKLIFAIFSSLGSHLISNESFYERSAHKIAEQATL